MSAEYRPLTLEDYEQAAYVEAVAFYNKSTPERVELMRTYFPPEWTVGAFVDGKLVADTRTIPTGRRINGGVMPFGTIGPVACLPAYRRRGHVGKLLRLTLERMREHGQPLAGLYTPHDALYARYGWERAEAKKRYDFHPKDVQLRLAGPAGRLEQVTPDDWKRLEAVFKEWAAPRNGPLLRVEPWWRESVLRHGDPSSGGRSDNDSFVWVSTQGRDEGYVVYHIENLGRSERGYPIWGVIVRDMVSLGGDAYLALWRHLLTHDLDVRVIVDVPIEDPFPDLTADPRRIKVTKSEGAMLRVVDVERAIGLRPYCGRDAIAFTMAIADVSAPWNEGTWRVEAADGQIRAKRTEAPADLELTANTLAPLFTGHMRPEVAAGAGLLRVNRAEALREVSEAFAVTHEPFCNDWY